MDISREDTEMGQDHTWLQRTGEVMGEQSRLGGAGALVV